MRRKASALALTPDRAPAVAKKARELGFSKQCTQKLLHLYE